MESVELEKFQDLSDLTQKKHDIVCENDHNAEQKIAGDKQMFSDTEMDNQILPDINGNLVKNTKCNESNENAEETSQHEDEESSSDNEFKIKQFSTLEELQLSLKEKGITDITKSLSDDEDLENIEKQENAVISWIQCDKPECQKWRKLDIDDVSKLSDEKWHCSMNSDPRRNDCTLSQEEWTEGSEDESVYTSFKPGVIVLGKMAGYPWWPGIIEDDPDFDSFFYLDKKPGRDKVIVSYHVTFFGKDVSRAWLLEVSLRRFKGDETPDDLGQLSYNGKSFSKKAMGALTDAKVAMKLTLERRVETFGFLNRYKGKRLPPKDRNQSSSSSKLIKDTLLEVKKSKKRLIEEVEEFSSRQYLDDDEGDVDDDYLEDKPMPKRMRMPGKQTARKIKETALPSNVSKKEKKMKKKGKRERKERKRLLRLQNERSMGLLNEGQVQAKLETSDIQSSLTTENQDIVNADDGEVPVFMDDTDIAEEVSNDRIEDTEEVMEADVIEIDPSVITLSQNQAELMVEKYSDPGNLKTFVDSLGDTTESFVERIKKEKAIKEEAEHKRKMREEKKLARTLTMETKLKQREEKQALLKAKTEKKSAKSKKSEKQETVNKIPKKKIKEAQSDGKKLLPTFDVNKKKTFQVKSNRVIPCASVSNVASNDSNLTTTNNTKTVETTESTMDMTVNMNSPGKEKLSEVPPVCDVSPKKKAFQVVSKSGEPCHVKTNHLHVDNEKAHNKEEQQASDLASPNRVDDSSVTKDVDSSHIDSEKIDSVRDECENKNENDHCERTSQQEKVTERPLSQEKSPFMSALDKKIDSPQKENSENQNECTNTVQELKPTASKSLFMSALDVEEANSVGCSPENNSPQEQSPLESEKLPNSVHSTLPVDSENEKSLKEKPKLTKPTFKNDGPKVVPTFSAKKPTAKRSGAKR